MKSNLPRAPNPPQSPNPPRSPLVRGEAETGGASPSPDKGRAGEGFGRAGDGFEASEEFAFLPYNKTLTPLARENRKNPTPAESLIWNKVLRSRQLLRYKFLRQKPIGGYIVDFYCSELHLVIEIDGESHAQQADYDVERTRFLSALGLVVIRYPNQEVVQNIAGVFENLSGHVATRIEATDNHEKSALAGRQ
jgi:very-short-patch-repair endonuclease